MRRAIALVLVFSLLMWGRGEAAAQTAVITGQVVDVETRVPLAGAVVTVQPGGERAISDGEGRFRIEGVSPGMIRIEAAFLATPGP